MHKKTVKIQILLILFLGTLANLFFLNLYYFPRAKSLFGDEKAYFAFAKRLVQGNPMELPPFWPPLYRWVLSFTFSWTGAHPLGVQLIQIILYLVCGYLLYRISFQITGHHRLSMIPMILFLFCPDVIFYSHALWPEIFHISFLLLAFWLLIAYPGNRLFACLSGLSLGLALLTKLLSTYYLLIFFAWVYFQTKDFSTKRRWQVVLILAVCTYVPTIPVRFHNLETYNRFMIADSLIFNVETGLRDVEFVDWRNDMTGDQIVKFHDSGATFQARQNQFKQNIKTILASEFSLKFLGWRLLRQYSRVLNQETFFTSQLPGGPRASYHFDSPGLTSFLRFYSHFFHALVLSLGFFGLCFVPLRPLNWLQPLFIFVVYNFGIFFIVHVKTRYLIQVYPFLMLFAMIPVSPLVALKTVKGDHEFFVVNRWRIICGSAITVLVLLFAFWPH